MLYEMLIEHKTDKEIDELDAQLLKPPTPPRPTVVQRNPTRAGQRTAPAPGPSPSAAVPAGAEALMAAFALPPAQQQKTATATKKKGHRLA